MKKFLFIAALSAIAVHASPLCSSLTPTYQSLINTGSGGCSFNTIGGTLTAANFSFASTALGTGQIISASQVSFTLDNPGVASGSGDLIYGFEFNVPMMVMGIGSEDLTFQYDLFSPANTAIISSNHLLMTGMASGLAVASVSEGPNCGKVTAASGCTFLPTLSVTQQNPEANQENLGPFYSLHVFKDANVTAVGGDAIPSLAGISVIRDSVDVTRTPEPSTWLLGGFSLLGMAAFGRRKRA